ncbi:hypothetical protein PILCRDRAFT_76019 [Piloderma croceum F 1598]|uniref:Major facilitator superfamily (MFS) profile domain-containing protein n=1 Tax=Piloderma croceum (strain F 1598) TaxID=765440 RepID=A0A0C3AVM7_PILCF|nr:hypothetical protein PILCRDRAFT_76019 [Piloderma croceum F 1598]
MRKSRTRSLCTISAEERPWKNDIVTFDSKDDPQNPKNWSYRRKAFVTMLFGLTTMCSTFASSVFSPAFRFIAKEYNVSTEVVTLGLSLFVIGFVPGPIVFAPFSEMYGRRISVLLPMFTFICFSAATATAANLQTVMITRFFAGVMASSPVTTVGGGLADMYEQRERGTAVVFYSLAVVAGPTLGPVIGAAVSQSHLGWRWTEYLTVILTSVVVLADIVFLPETYAPVILTRKARKLRLKTGRWALHSRHETNDFTLRGFLETNLLRPVKMIFTCLIFSFLSYDMLPLKFCLYITDGILYLLFGAVPIIYEQNRGWNTLQGSLPFLAVLLGTFFAAAVNAAYSQLVFAPNVDKHGGKTQPEKRLPPMMLGSITFPIGFFLLGWTSNPKIFWFPSVLGLFFIGMSFLLIFQAGINYLVTDGMKLFVLQASNTFMRSLFAATLPLIAQPLFNNLGVDWACTLLGCISVILAWVFDLKFSYALND